MRKEELQGSSADDSFKEKRNEAVAGGVDAFRRRCVMCICVGSAGETAATDRQMVSGGR